MNNNLRRINAENSVKVELRVLIRSMSPFFQSKHRTDQDTRIKSQSDCAKCTLALCNFSYDPVSVRNVLISSLLPVELLANQNITVLLSATACQK